MIKYHIFFIVILLSCFSFSQDYIPKNDGVKTINSNYTVFTNAKIYITPNQVVNNGTLVIKDGKVVSVGDMVAIPENAVITNLKGKSIYPSFIDIYSSFGIAPIVSPKNHHRKPQYDATREGYYWNDHIRPEQNAMTYFSFDSKKAKILRKMGFGVVNTHIDDGIIKGTGALISLQNNGNDATRILDEKSVQYIGTKKSKTSKQSYPSSLMGTMALLRQVNYDANWYSKGNIKIKDRALEAFNSNKNEVQILNAGSKINVLRFDKIGDQFNTQYIFVGGGDEYERIKEIKATNAKFIIPIDFPEVYDMEDPFLSRSIDLSQMRAWNQKPFNLKILAQNNILFALTTHKLKKKETFLSQLRKAIDAGLDKVKALEALTTVPAQLIGKQNIIGSLKVGAYANFLITSGEIFAPKTIIYQNWVLGHKEELVSMTVKDLRGEYTFTINSTSYELTLSGKIEKLKSKIKANNKEIGSKVSYKNNWLNLTFSDIDTTKKGFYRLFANVSDLKTIKGKVIFPNGMESGFTANKSSEIISIVNNKENNTPKARKMFPVSFPNMAYGFSTLPSQKTYLFKNATIWTNEKEGILEHTDVLVKNGKISKIGSNLKYSAAHIIDAKGKHLTSGIIDEHSHIATSSVNETGHNSTAEVTIEDVINPEDINIYRNLAGGVTSIQILHGSANPIGGQSAIIKLKWGESASQMIYENTPKFIKFALGENVKQSNWGNNATVRFPQTRMGVEQVYIDYFQRAKEYDILKKSGQPYRKDIELETLSEILNKERFISCHSYVQSEINMLMKVAEKFNFKINTFTHILEGYKVADKMAKHGVGGSTFSDWWAYKYEVKDAIPMNAAIMHREGVTVAINSDDSEMSRRLNQEAAKSMKYAGMSEEEAWKLVTLNPAKLLHIEDRVGSIKVGKDADLVLWSTHPLSIYAKAEKTLIEGKVYFDIQQDKKIRKAIKTEKNELITLMLQAKNKGLKTQPIKKKVKQHFHCDTEI